MLHKNAARTTFPVIVSIAIALTITLALPLTAHAKTIFLGDSRTVGMYNTVAGYAPSVPHESSEFSSVTPQPSSHSPPGSICQSPDGRKPVSCRSRW